VTDAVVPTTRGARTRATRRRSPALVGLVGVLAVLSVVSATTQPSSPTTVMVSAAAVAPASESSAAFCAGLEDVPGEVRSTVTLADVAAAGRTLEVTTTDEHDRVARRLVALRPGHVVRLDPAHLLRGSDLAMSVVADGGGVVATEALTGPDGTAVAPCLTSAGTSWSVTGGSTEPGQRLQVAVFNPYTTSAQVNVAFLTPAGYVVPTAYRGLELRAHQLVGIDVHDLVPNASPITTLVTTTSGNVVVYTVGSSTSGTPSVSLLAAAPLAARTAVLPVTPNHTGAATSLVVANPSTVPSSASVTLSWSPGCGAHCAAPLEVAVAPGSTSMLQLGPTSRVPTGLAMSATVTATGPGVVLVQRVVTRRAVGQSTPLDDPGGVGATQLALVDPTGAGFDRVAITNTTSSAATVELASPGPHGIVVHGAVVVPAGGVTQLDRASLRWLVGGVLVLQSTAPVYAVGQVGHAVLGADLLTAVPLG
jgi:hypothetical protein